MSPISIFCYEFVVGVQSSYLLLFTSTYQFTNSSYWDFFGTLIRISGDYFSIGMLYFYYNYYSTYSKNDQ